MCIFTLTTHSQTKIWDIETDIFKSILKVQLYSDFHKVECPNGIDRSVFNNGMVASDIDDQNNEWDRDYSYI